MKNKKIEKSIWYIITAVYILFAFYFCRLIGFDADKANHILQAQDILQGNFWLKDWNLTGVTFFTTDLLYYELALLITGSIGYRTAYIAYGLMALAVMALSMTAILFHIHEYRKQRLVLFFCLFAIPCMNYWSALRTHSGAVSWSIIAILIATSVLMNERSDTFSKGNVAKYLFLFISLLLGITGDILTALEGAIPILFYCIITIINSSGKYSVKSDKRTYLMISSLAAVAGAIAIDRLYFFIGGANRNSYIGYEQFSSVAEWHDKFWSFVLNLLLMGDAGFMNGMLNDIWNYTKIINAVILVTGVTLVFYTIFSLVRGRSVEVISAILSIAFILIACACVFTEKSGFKYIIIEPAICYIVLLRRYDSIIAFMKNRKLWIGLIYVITIISLAGKVEAITHYDYPDEILVYKELTAFLNEHDLHYGYASFWNASVFSVVSNNKVNVRHIKRDSKGRFTMYNWFNKNQWYLEETNFVIVDNTKNDRGSSDGHGLSEDNVVAYFGTPSERYECSGHIIMVYDHNLSKYLVGIEDGKIIPFELFCNDKVDTVGEELNKVFLLHRGGVVDGPYISIVPGEYSLVFEGDKLDKVRVDVFSKEVDTKNKDYIYRFNNNIRYNVRLNDSGRDYNENDRIAYQVKSQSIDTIVVDFKIDKTKVEDVEFRVFCDEDVEVRLDQIIISKAR